MPSRRRWATPQRASSSSACATGGGIRAQIGKHRPTKGDKTGPVANPDAGKAAGGVSQLDVDHALCFENKPLAFEIMAAGPKAILEHGVAAGITQGRSAAGRRPVFLLGSRPARPAAAYCSVALVDAYGRVVARPWRKARRWRGCLPSSPSTTTNFMANCGDGDPIKANGSNFRFLLADCTLGPRSTRRSTSRRRQRSATNALARRRPSPTTCRPSTACGHGLDGSTRSRA